jgi:hypothetical protein
LAVVGLGNSKPKKNLIGIWMVSKVLHLSHIVYFIVKDMTLFAFMASNPWLSFFIIVMICLTIDSIITNICKAILRRNNIKEHGWPPEHLDADGDFKKVDD